MDSGQGASWRARGAGGPARPRPRLFRRCTVGAWLFDALCLEWPVYGAGRRAGIEMLALQPGEHVLDIGCGTGPNFPLLREAVGRTGRIVGVDASTQMIAQASAKASRLGWVNIDLVHAGATTLTPAWLRARLGPGGGTDGAEAVLSTYSLSLAADWPGAWRAATSAARPGARVAVVDMRMPTGAAAVFVPLARLACTLGGSDITADPWTTRARLHLRAGVGPARRTHSGPRRNPH